MRQRDRDEVVGAAASRRRRRWWRRRVLPVRGQPGGDRDQVLLGHADVEEAVGKGVAERQDVGVLAEVGGQADDLRPRARRARQRLAERRLDGRTRARPPRPGPWRGAPRRSCRRSELRSKSAMMPSQSATSTRKKCDFSLRLDARHALAGQRPQHDRLRAGRCAARAAASAADDRAPCRCRRSRCVSQPKARHLSATGSMSRTSGPSAWMPLQSTSATRSSSPKCARRHRRLPGRALLQLAVGELDEDARRPSRRAAARAPARPPGRGRGRASRRSPRRPGVVSSVDISSRLSSAP